MKSKNNNFSAFLAAIFTIAIFGFFLSTAHAKPSHSKSKPSHSKSKPSHSSSSSGLVISQTPLFLSTNTKPNIMIEMDNSSSMNTIIHKKGYNPSKIYPRWDQKCSIKINGSSNGKGNSNGTGSGKWSRIFKEQNGQTCYKPSTKFTRSNSQIAFGKSTGHNVRQSRSCPGGYVLGRKVNVTGKLKATRITKCIKLPYSNKSKGSNVRYSTNYINYLFSITKSSYKKNKGSSCNGNYKHSKINATCINYKAVNLNKNGQIPRKTRIQVAEQVATNIVKNNTNMNFGLADFNQPTYKGGHYNGAPGGKIVAGTHTKRQTLIHRIKSINARSNTPLAETYYEITRYFRGMSSYYNKGVNYTSPIKYPCQKNFVIVITDGLSTYDMNFPKNDPQAGKKLPNFDGLAPYTTRKEVQHYRIPKNSDGWQDQVHNKADQKYPGYSLYLDDLTLFGHKDNMAPKSFNTSKYGPKHLSTYTIGYSTQNQNLKDAARKGDGKYYTARNQKQLQKSLDSAIQSIQARISSSSSVATNSTRLSKNSQVFQAKFKSKDWVGNLLDYTVSSQGKVSSSPKWQAKGNIPSYGNRNLLSYNNNTQSGIKLNWSNLSSKEQKEANINEYNINDGLGKKRVKYVKGNHAFEKQNGGQFRNRKYLLGDIVNSNPYYVGNNNYGFSALPGQAGKTYRQFLKSTAHKNRKKMVYVAANDGFLHGFNAKNGNEVFGYLPSVDYKRIRYLTNPNYKSQHKYLNDGSPNVVDAYLNNTWQSVLLGSTGAGGRSFYALNVTHPSNFNSSDVMWEFDGSNHPNLGYTLGEGAVARMKNGQWVALIPNGYNSPSGDAVLFIVNLKTGKLIKKINTGVGNGNGLSGITPVDTNGNGITNYAYAGDLKGNMWKFNFTSSNPSNWGIAFGGQPLFNTCGGTCNKSNVQPITEKPQVIFNSGNHSVKPGGQVVLFGTGEYFAVGDNIPTNQAQQSFYGIYDRNNQPVSKSNLVQQKITQTTTVNYKGTTTQALTSTNYNLKQANQGWYLNFNKIGERQVSQPAVQNGHVIFSTLIPNSKICGYGGNSFLMELNALTGSRLKQPPFDLNGDNKFNKKDMIQTSSGKKNVSGLQIINGIIQTPRIVKHNGIQYKYASSTSGAITTTVENGVFNNGVQSWIQLH